MNIYQIKIDEWGYDCYSELIFMLYSIKFNLYFVFY
jgi:hypothetical protein